MLTRRQFLKGTMTTLVLIPIVGCGSDGGSPSGTGNPGTCEGVSSTGTNTGGHIHTLCVPTSDLTSPPASGRTYTTSSNSGHTHSVTLSQVQLQNVESGGSVTVDSTGGGHTHAFTIEKA
jgi:hypothetical protein